MAKESLAVRATWDAETGFWWAVSEDIPGLVAEAETFEELKAEIAALAPELLELNDCTDRIGLPLAF